MPRIRSLRSITSGWSGWRRAKASSWPVSAAARAAAWTIASAKRIALVLGEAGPAQHVGRALDDGQQVVEIVGDAAGQLAERLHLLGLAELLLGLGALLDLDLELGIGVGLSASARSSSSRLARRSAVCEMPRTTTTSTAMRISRPMTT